MIKAMFFDLDGTLLDSGKRIPDSALRALEACRKRGVQLFLATGRSPRLREMLGWTSEQEALFDGGVFCNGACLVLSRKTRYLRLSEDVARGITARVNEIDRLNIALQMEGNAHAFNHPLERHAFGQWGIDEAKPIREEDYARTVKILIYFENLIDSVTPIPKNLLESLSAYEDEANIYLTDAGKAVQVAPRGASKFAGVDAIRKRLGLLPEEIAVFGDDTNDLEMIAGFPNSVAMGNACEEIKEKASFVTRTNDEGGIAWAVERLIASGANRFDAAFLSAEYPAKRLSAQDADAILKLYEGNPQYFAAMHSPATRESVLDDLTALPPGKTAEDKFFVGFYDGDALVAVMDWIDGYPDGRTAFIGLFVVDAACQGKGVGSAIVRDCLSRFARLGFKRARLGYVETNPQSKAFWEKNGFEPTGERSEREGYAVILAEKAF